MQSCTEVLMDWGAEGWGQPHLVLMELELCWALCWLWRIPPGCYWKKESTFAKIVHENDFFI